MARSRFSNNDQPELVSQRVDVRVRGGSSAPRNGAGGSAGKSETTTKHLIWWSALHIFLALLAVILLSAWIVRKHGGLAWKNPDFLKGGFNYHPLFMVIAFMLLSGIGDILYRMCRLNNKLSVKVAHGVIQLTGFIFMVVALCAVFWYHDVNGSSHLQSAHSWIGLIVVLLVACQWLMGFCGLLWPGFRPPLRASYVVSHKFTGRCIFLLSMANILIGINKVSNGSTVLNVLALIVILYALNGAYIMANNAFTREALAGDSEIVEVYERRTSIHNRGGNVEDNRYINISTAGAGGQYQSMGDDPIVKEAM